MLKYLQDPDGLAVFQWARVHPRSQRLKSSGRKDFSCNEQQKTAHKWVCACFATKLALSLAIWADDVLVHEAANGWERRVSPRYLFIFIYLISPLTRPRQRYTHNFRLKKRPRASLLTSFIIRQRCVSESGRPGWPLPLIRQPHQLPVCKHTHTHTPAHSLFAAAQVYGSQQRINSLRAHNENKMPLKLNTQFWLTASSVCLFVASCWWLLNI